MKAESEKKNAGGNAELVADAQCLARADDGTSAGVKARI